MNESSPISVLINVMFCLMVAGIALSYFLDIIEIRRKYPREPKDIEMSAAELARLTPAELAMRETELILMRDAVRRALLQIAGRRAGDAVENK